MTINPYATPLSPVADPSVTPAIAPPMWNPVAASRWSLLFGPAFGAWLHMNNWQALGETTRAKVARSWTVAGFALPLALALSDTVMPASKLFDALSQLSGVLLLLAWYALAGREQHRYVQARYGQSYPHRRWRWPLLIAVLLIGAFFALAMALVFVHQLLTDTA